MNNDNRIITVAFGLCFALALFVAAHAQNGNNPTGGGGGGAATCGSTANGICYNNSGAFASDGNLTYAGSGVVNALELVRPSGAGIKLDVFGGNNGVDFDNNIAHLGGVWNQGAGQIVYNIVSSGWYGWVAGSDITQPVDTAFKRIAPGSIGIVGGSAPTLSSCGTGTPTVLTGSDDSDGEITEGTTVSGCVVTMANTSYAQKPSCVVAFPAMSLVTAQTYVVGFSGGTVTLTISNITGSGFKFNYHCRYFS
jgi:hypothetical protein